MTTRRRSTLETRFRLPLGAGSETYDRLFCWKYTMYISYYATKRFDSLSAMAFVKPLCAISLMLFLVACSKAPASVPAAENSSIGKIVRLDPAFDALVSTDAKIERVATGFTFTEGPLWRPEGVLWFSDVPGNLVRSVSPAGEVKVIIQNAGRRRQRSTRSVYRAEWHDFG